MITENGKTVVETREKSFEEIELERKLTEALAEVSRLNGEALINSVKYESEKKESEEKIKKLELRLSTTSVFLNNMLEHIEADFDNEGKFESVEEAEEYLDAAKYQERFVGRKNNRIIGVSEWFNNEIAE